MLMADQELDCLNHDNNVENLLKKSVSKLSVSHISNKSLKAPNSKVETEKFKLQVTGQKTDDDATRKQVWYYSVYLLLANTFLSF
jgi:hypothetical protein